MLEDNLKLAVLTFTVSIAAVNGAHATNPHAPLDAPFDATPNTPCDHGLGQRILL